MEYKQAYSSGEHTQDEERPSVVRNEKSDVAKGSLAVGDISKGDTISNLLPQTQGDLENSGYKEMSGAKDNAQESNGIMVSEEQTLAGRMNFETVKANWVNNIEQAYEDTEMNGFRQNKNLDESKSKNTSERYESTENKGEMDLDIKNKKNFTRIAEELTQECEAERPFTKEELSLNEDGFSLNKLSGDYTAGAGSQSGNFEKAPDIEDSLLPFRGIAKEPKGPRMVPPDGGWGWLVAFGAFIIVMFLLSIGSCFSIFFNGFLTDRDASSTTIAWIYNTQLFIWDLTGPLVNSLITEFGSRKIGYIGVSLASMSMIISAFSPSTGFLFFSFSFLGGLGAGLCVTMSFILVPQYFDRRQGLANTFLMTGVCMSQISGAPLAGYLLDEYGFKGAIIIFGAILLNGFVAVSVYHPVQWHMKKAKSSESDSPCEALPIEGRWDETNDYQIKVGKTASEEINEKEEWKIGSLSCMDNKDPAMRKVPAREDSRGSFQIVRDIVIRVAKGILSDFKIIKMYRAIIIGSGIALSFIAYVNFLMILPFAMKAAGFSLDDASRLISMFGMSNMVTRLTISPLSDWRRFNHRVCIMSGYAIVGFCAFVFPFMMTTMERMMATIVLMGCGVGTNMTLNNLVMIKYLGIKNLPAMIGVTTLTIGIGAIIFGPFIGFVRDVTDSFAVSMWILSSMLGGSFTLWLFMPAAIRFDLEKANKEKSEQHP